MLLRTLIIASILVFIAGCESELDRCIDANTYVQYGKIQSEKYDKDPEKFKKIPSQEALIAEAIVDVEKAEKMATQFCNLQGIY